MKKEKIINIILALAVVVLLGILALSVRFKPTTEIKSSGGSCCVRK